MLNSPFNEENCTLYDISNKNDTKTVKTLETRRRSCVRRLVIIITSDVSWF